MPDPADVVPLHRGGPARFAEPAAVFADVSEPARGLSVTWAPDQQTVRFGIDSALEGPSAVVVSAEDLLELVQVLLEGLPRPGSDTAALAAVIPLRSREPHPFTEGS